MQKKKEEKKESVERRETEEKKAEVLKLSEQEEKETENGKAAMSKWGRLGQYYKKKIPFGDEREFLCISPEDLIVLPEKYEHLYKNSFLLHGYYAYGHILLGTETTGNRPTYGLYIPGVGHEKERAVAEMFGFGRFFPASDAKTDGTFPNTKDAQERQFGYYKMTVEL